MFTGKIGRSIPGRAAGLRWNIGSNGVRAAGMAERLGRLARRQWLWTDSQWHMPERVNAGANARFRGHHCEIECAFPLEAAQSTVAPWSI